MKHLIFILFIYSAFTLEVNAQTGWYEQTSGTSQRLYAVHFVNENTGYAVGMSGVVIKTTDGGNNWLNKTANTENNLRGVYFVDENTGTIVGEFGSIFRTTNGGSNWIFQENPIGYYTLYNVFFINANTGCIVGFYSYHQNGIVIMTTNGGDSWMNRSFTHDASYYDAYFFNQNEGIVVGQYPEIIKTTNSCLTWSIQNVNSIIYGVSFSDTDNGVCVGSGGKLLLTSNSGDNWTDYNSGMTNDFYGVSHGSRDDAVVVGSGGIILRTTNAGINWFTQQSSLTSDLQSVSFVNSYTGWAVGESGKIIKTTDGGGIIGISPISNEIPKDFFLSQNFPNPFNPRSNIEIKISKLSFVKLIIYNNSGKEIMKAVNQELRPGIYSVEIDGANFPSGVYYYRLTAGDFMDTKKMILVK
jgi:photosystem II stability/assembly factor-like uncharacterized protein